MAIRAYREIYLSRAMGIMGDAFDYALNDCEISGKEFVKIFASSMVCKRMENGEASYLLGKSGIEIVNECVKEITGKVLDVEPKESFGRSAEYWCGWAVCYYQWYSNRSYRDIFNIISFDEFRTLYPTLHEADVSKFAEVIDEKMKKAYSETNLKRIRTSYGCSQSELAKLSDVSLRSIQLYEQHQKDINKAQSDTLYKLAKALGCNMEDLLEN